RGLRGGCEGRLREDLNCDGRLNDGSQAPLINEDRNGNGVLDPGEDLNGDNILNDGGSGPGHGPLINEDRNHSGYLDDPLFGKTALFDPNHHTTTFYPYGHASPTPADRDYTIDQRRGITSGPYFETTSDRRQRFTLREDLSLYVPDYYGSHDLKIGGIAER